MATEAKAARLGTAAEDSDNDNDGKEYCDTNKPLQDAVNLLRGAAKVTDNPKVRIVLEDCAKLVTDVCMMSHGFGAALRAKYKSG